MHLSDTRHRAVGAVAVEEDYPEDQSDVASLPVPHHGFVHQDYALAKMLRTGKIVGVVSRSSAVAAVDHDNAGAGTRGAGAGRGSAGRGSADHGAGGGGGAAGAVVANTLNS